MTSLSEYLKAERPDRTEPTSFYVPGVKEWEDLTARFAFPKSTPEPRADTDDLDPLELI